MVAKKKRTDSAKRREMNKKLQQYYESLIQPIADEVFVVNSFFPRK